MKNIGSTAWPEPARLIFVGGDVLSESEAVIVPSIQPNEEVDITVDMVAPASPGRYVSKYRLCTPEGARFGHCVWADITVVESQEGAEEEVKEPVVEVSKKVDPPVSIAVIVEEKKVEEKKPEEKKPEEKKVEQKVDEEEGFTEVLDQLAGMGFADRKLNLRFLKTNNGDILLTVHQLLSL